MELVVADSSKAKVTRMEIHFETTCEFKFVSLFVERERERAQRPLARVVYVFVL